MTDRQHPPLRRARVQWASTIEPRRQEWLLDQRIPVGTITALAGRGGVGKTTLALHWAARLSHGTLPGKYYANPRATLIWSGEDEWEPVLVPRLIAAGADRSRIGKLSIETQTDEATGETTPRLPLDAREIAEAITDAEAALVIIDPIASTMGGDLHREADVRHALDTLARLAADTGAVIAYVRHFGKGGGNASDKMSGSHAFRDAARSVFLFAADDQDDGRVIVTQDKGNYGRPGSESFAYRLESTTVDTLDGPAEVARIIELGEVDTTVNDIINRDSRGEVDDSKEIDRWLTDLLANGPVKATEVYSSADAAGFSKDQAKRAKKRLKIDAQRPQNPGPWFWALPAEPRAESAEQADSTHALPALPALPVRSEGVQQGADSPRERDNESCTLPAPCPDQSRPTPLTVRQQHLRKRRTIRVKGKEVPRCPVCGKAVMVGQGDAHLSCLSKTETAS